MSRVPSASEPRAAGPLAAWAQLPSRARARVCGELSCLVSERACAFTAAMKITNATRRVEKLKATVVPVRQAIVDVWEDLTMNQLQSVNTRGAMGKIQNMEAITKPKLLDRLGASLGKKKVL